jgi:hypothetical protein
VKMCHVGPGSSGPHRFSVTDVSRPQGRYPPAGAARAAGAMALRRQPAPLRPIPDNPQCTYRRQGQTGHSPKKPDTELPGCRSGLRAHACVKSGTAHPPSRVVLVNNHQRQWPTPACVCPGCVQRTDGLHQHTIPRTALLSSAPAPVPVHRKDRPVTKSHGGSRNPNITRARWTGARRGEVSSWRTPTRLCRPAALEPR